MYDRSQFRKGLDVYDRDGNKIGDISDVGPSYLHISTGFLGLGQDLYIPFSMVDRVNDQGVKLNATKNTLSSGDYSKPLTEATAAVPAAVASSVAPATPMGQTITPEEVRGHNLCDVNGKQIGSISGIGRNYFHVVTGLLGLGQDLYVPIDAVDHCSRSCCYLNLTTDEMRSRDWTTRPSTETFAGTATAATVGRPAEVAAAAPRNVYRIPLREEELEIHRHREQVGEVIISKEIVEEQQTINVPVSHEEVRIERHAVHGEAENVGPITKESASETIRVPVYEERVDVEKRPRVSEEIVVCPEETTRQERVTETLRREVPHVRTTGEADEYVEDEANIEGKPAIERKAEEANRENRQRRAGE